LKRKTAIMLMFYALCVVQESVLRL